MLQSLISELVKLHHLAFGLGVVGRVNALGLSQGQVDVLVSSGAVSVVQLAGWFVPGMRHDVDPFLFLHLVALEMEHDPTAEKRDRTLQEWGPLIDSRIDAAGGSGLSLLPSRDVAAYAAAMKRAGDFAVGVGADVEADVKELTARAVAERWSPDALGSALGERSGVWVHNWGRVARTELQGAYNEGRVYSALEGHGAGARVARFPETGACKHCRRLFLDKDGKPRVFTVDELANNGTNAGRKTAAWRATIWPVHPNCRCDLITVPSGLIVGKDGKLRREDDS